MNRHGLELLVSLLVVLTFGSPGRTVGQEVDEAQPSAQFLASFFDDDTFGVARIDFEHFEIHWLYELAARIPDFVRTHPHLPQEETVLRIVKAFRAAGGKDLYFLLRVGDLERWKPFALVPLAPGSDPDTIAAVLKEPTLRPLLRFEVTKQVGDVMLAGDAKTLVRLRTLESGPRPELARALQAVAGHTVQIVLMPSNENRNALEQWALPRIAGDANARPWLREAVWAAAGFSGPPDSRLKLAAAAANAEAAERIRLSTDALFDGQGRRDDVRRIWPDFAQLKTFFAWKPDGANLSISLNDSQGRLSALAEAVVWAPLAAASADTAARLDTIGHVRELEIALHAYYYKHKALPPPAISGADGAPLLSWRVALLPFLEEPSAHDLYRQFRLDEPWDSPHNETLLAKMPTIYHCPKSKVAASGRTVYLAPRGLATVFPGPNGLRFMDVVDGLSLTIDLVEVDDDHAVAWTRPADWNLDSANPAAGLGGHFPGLLIVGLCDGSVQTLKSTIDKNTLRALFTRNGGEVVMWPNN